MSASVTMLPWEMSAQKTEGITMQRSSEIPHFLGARRSAFGPYTEIPHFLSESEQIKLFAARFVTDCIYCVVYIKEAQYIVLAYLNKRKVLFLFKTYIC